MMIDREIQEQEMKLKALHYERDRMAKGCETLGASVDMGYVGNTVMDTTASRWSPDFIRDVVGYHAPGSEGSSRIAAMRTATEMFMRSIVENCPDCADRTAALRHAREAMMTSNASIVLGGRI